MSILILFETVGILFEGVYIYVYSLLLHFRHRITVLHIDLRTNMIYVELDFLMLQLINQCKYKNSHFKTIFCCLDVLYNTDLNLLKESSNLVRSTNLKMIILSSCMALFFRVIQFVCIICSIKLGDHLVF